MGDMLAIRIMRDVAEPEIVANEGVCEAEDRGEDQRHGAVRGEARGGERSQAARASRGEGNRERESGGDHHGEKNERAEEGECVPHEDLAHEADPK